MLVPLRGRHAAPHRNGSVSSRYRVECSRMFASSVSIKTPNVAPAAVSLPPIAFVALPAVERSGSNTPSSLMFQERRD
jgi:hypothetical protein